MIPIQVTAGNWNDGTIIACCPVVANGTNQRIVLRDLKQRYSVQTQCWQLFDPLSRGVHVLPTFITSEYYNKANVGALSRAWSAFVERSNRLLAPSFHQINEKEGATP